MPDDPDLIDMMNAISRTRLVDRRISKLNLRRQLSTQGFLRAYFPPTEVRVPVPEQDLK